MRGSYGSITLALLPFHLLCRAKSTSNIHQHPTKKPTKRTFLQNFTENPQFGEISCHTYGVFHATSILQWPFSADSSKAWRWRARSHGMVYWPGQDHRGCDKDELKYNYNLCISVYICVCIYIYIYSNI